MPVGGKTLLERWLSHLDGCDEIFVNAHALSPLLHEHVKAMHFNYGHLRTFHEPRILGSGGSLFAMSRAFPNEWMIAVNGDTFFSRPELKFIFSQIDYETPSVYLVLRNESRFNNIIVDAEGFVRHIRKSFLNETELARGYRVLAYTGVQIFHTDLLVHYGAMLAKRLEPAYSSVPFMDVMEIYTMMIDDSVPVRYLEINDGLWCDVGTIKRYIDLCLAVCDGVMAGKDVILEPGIEVSSTILWDGVRIKSGSKLDKCIVTDGVIVDGMYQRAIITHCGVWKL